jgi:CRISPR-associated protein Cas1
VLEIFRSGVDLFALNLLAELTPESFYYREAEGCRLSKAARPLFYREWAIYRDNWPRPLANSGALQLETAPLQEQVRGQLRLLRQVLEEVKDAG